MKTPQVTLSHIWWVMPILLCYAMLSLAPLREGDLWWHLGLGEAIVRTRALPAVDQWTVAGMSLPFNAAHSWLSDVVFYALEADGGLSALVMLQAVVGTLTVGVLQRLAHGMGAPAKGAAVLSLLGFLALYPFSTARPQVFSFLLFTCFQFILFAVNAGKIYGLAILPGLMGLWVNLHGAWVMGLLLVGIYELVWAGAVLGGRRTLGSLWPHAASGVGIVLATLLNPRGIGVYQHLIVIGRSPVVQQFVSEWQPPSLTQSLTWPFWALLIAGCVLFVLHRPRSVSISMLAAAGFTVLALCYLRMIPFAVIALLPVLVAWLPKRPKVAEASGVLNAILLGILVASALLATPGVRLAAGVPSSSLIDPFFPAAACEVLKPSEVVDGRVFTLAEWGGYVGWQLWPDAVPFVDGRVELPPVEVWEDYFVVATGQPGWQEHLGHWGITHLLLSRQRQGRLADAAGADGWETLYEDEDVVVLQSPEYNAIGWGDS